MIIPSHLQIEPINGYCTSRCTMCSFPTWTRKPRRMTETEFKIILGRFIPYRDNLRYLTLHGCGEPLLDRGLPLKIKIAKELGFRGTGLATNCTELDLKTSQALLEAGLDTLICSIDGVTKETHESIRRGTDFISVVNNVIRFLEQRLHRGKTRVLVRFIRQKANTHEWLDFKTYWEQHLDMDKGDAVIKFDVHNWGGKTEDYQNKDVLSEQKIDSFICNDMYQRMLIYSNGDVGFCSADDNGFFPVGNVLYDDPITIYNNNIFNHYRCMMEQGKIMKLEHCCTCNIPRSRVVKDIVKGD